MMTPSCILLNPVTRSDLQAACVQAEAALQAGMMQTKATSLAGWLTLAAGAGAILAAFIAGWFAIRSAREQIGAARTDVANQLRSASDTQAKQRSHDLKSAVYIPAVKALATGLSVVVKLANLNVPTEQVMDGYNERLPDLLVVHLVAQPETADKLLKALRGLQELHQGLLPKRPFRTSHQYGREERISWGRTCTADMEKAIPSMVAAVAAMRGELDMPIDEEQYTGLIRDGIKEAIERNELLFEEMMA